MAKDFPDKCMKNTQQATTLCLRCRETCHKMFGCANDYPRDDVKEIKCYVCKQNGHLCCTDFSGSHAKEVIFYNCAQSGHRGLGCAKQRRETECRNNPNPMLKNMLKSGRFEGECSAHIRKKDGWKKGFWP